MIASRFASEIARGGYSSIVYKDGDLNVAEDEVGTVIEESTVASTVIQAALDHGVGKTLCLDGEYEINTQISIPSNRTLEGTGRGTIFAEPDPAIEKIIANDHIAGTSNFQIKNLTIDGKSRGTDWTHAIFMQNISYFNIENIHGINFTGSDPAWGRNNLITIGSTNIANRLGTYGHIHNITADNVRGDIVFLTGVESQAAFSEYVNIYDIIAKGATGNIVDINEVQFCNVHNIIGYGTKGADVLTDGAHYCNITNVTSIGSTVAVELGHHAPGTTGFSSFNNISNVLCYHPILHGIFVLNCSDNTISNFNLIGGVETGAGLLFVQAVGAGSTDEGVCSRNKFINGIVSEPKQHGVYVFESAAADVTSYNEFTNVSVVKNAGTNTYGFIADGDHCTFTSCIAKGSHINDGFYLYTATYGILNGCTATGCAGYGVHGASADYFMLIGNHLRGNSSGSTCTLGSHSKAPADSNFL